jgi:hypothetical protein
MVPARPSARTPAHMSRALEASRGNGEVSIRSVLMEFAP